MANIDRGVVTWSGPAVVGGGVTVMYATPGASFMTHIRTFFNALAGYLPNNVTLTFPSSGDTIDPATGNLVGSWSGAALSPVVGTNGITYPASCGGCIGWNTTTIVPAHGGKPPRLLRGRTFISPLAIVSYDTAGVLAAATVTAFTAAATTLIGSGGGNFVVWHRPTTPGGTDGLAGPVITPRVRPKAAVLTSRRD